MDVSININKMVYNKSFHRAGGNAYSAEVNIVGGGNDRVSIFNGTLFDIADKGLQKVFEMALANEYSGLVITVNGASALSASLQTHLVDKFIAEDEIASVTFV